MPEGRPVVVAVVGATATGKTALAEALARELGGEVVCADSRQVFRELEIGTGKPTPGERAALPHHLFDAFALGERTSAGAWAQSAAAVCREVAARGHVPVLAGGSGLYVRSLQHGIAAEPPHDSALRARLGEVARTRGAMELHAQLAAVDPETAARLAPTDAQRVTRALEVWHASGRPLSWWQRERAGAPFDARWRTIELVLEPLALDRRIESRTRDMFEHGLIEETRALLDAGFGDALGSLKAVGYDEAMALIAGGIDRPTAEQLTSRRTRQLAKRQRTWFRHQIEATRLPADVDPAELLTLAFAIARRDSDP